MSSIPSIQATFTPAAASTSTAQQTAVRQENESAKSSAQQNAGVVY